LTVTFAKVSIPSVLFGLLAVVPAAVAAGITSIPVPDAGYTSSTTLIPITGNDGDTQTTLGDGNLTITFSTLMQQFTVPGTWTTWGAPPAVESSTPRVLAPADFTVNSVTLTFSEALATFGIEVEPDAFSQGFFPVTESFYNGATLLGTIVNSMDGSTAALFAANSTTPITSVNITIAGNSNFPPGTDPAMAEFRYTVAAPEPGTMFGLATGLGMLLGLKRIRSARS
jgi:hypothetical protein